MPSGPWIPARGARGELSAPLPPSAVSSGTMTAHESLSNLHAIQSNAHEPGTLTGPHRDTGVPRGRGAKSPRGCLGLEVWGRCGVSEWGGQKDNGKPHGSSGRGERWGTRKKKGTRWRKGEAERKDRSEWDVTMGTLRKRRRERSLWSTELSSRTPRQPASYSHWGGSKI